jgi:hypothetical protein
VAVLPFGHALHHLVGDGGDGLLGDLGAVDLGQVRGDVPVGKALRGQRQHHLIHARQPALPLAHDVRLEAALHVPGHLDLDRPDIGQHGLRPGAVAAVAAVLPRRIVLVVPEVIGDLALQGGLQHPLVNCCSSPSAPVSCMPSLRARSTSIAINCSSDVAAPTGSATDSCSNVISLTWRLHDQQIRR